MFEVSKMFSTHAINGRGSPIGKCISYPGSLYFDNIDGILYVHMGVTTNDYSWVPVEGEEEVYVVNEDKSIIELLLEVIRITEKR